MASKPLHLGWFMNFMPGEWDHPLSVGGSPWDGKFYVDMAQALERACFDYIMIEDTLMVSETYGGSAEAGLKHAQMVPKHDPAPLAALIGAATSHLGVVATCKYNTPDAGGADTPVRLVLARTFALKSWRLRHIPMQDQGQKQSDKSIRLRQKKPAPEAYSDAGRLSCFSLYSCFNLYGR